MGSGTDALRFALMAVGVEPCSMVVTVPNTFIATTEAITQAGGVPHFVDIDERTYNIDPEKLLEGSGKRMRHVKRSWGEAADDTALQALIAAAYADMRQRLTLL